MFQSVNIFVKDTSSLYQKAFSFSIFTWPWLVRLSSEYLQEMIGFCWMANSATANPKVSPNFWARPGKLALALALPREGEYSPPRGRS